MANSLMQYFPILFSAFIMVIKSSPANKAVTFIGSEQLRRTVEQDIFQANATFHLERMYYGELKDYSSLLGEKTLSITSFYHRASHLYFDDVITNCRDKQVSVELAK
jgi:hypothetical protein